MNSPEAAKLNGRFEWQNQSSYPHPSKMLRQKNFTGGWVRVGMGAESLFYIMLCLPATHFIT